MKMKAGRSVWEAQLAALAALARCLCPASISSCILPACSEDLRSSESGAMPPVTRSAEAPTPRHRLLKLHVLLQLLLEAIGDHVQLVCQSCLMNQQFSRTSPALKAGPLNRRLLPNPCLAHKEKRASGMLPNRFPSATASGLQMLEGQRSSLGVIHYEPSF